MLPLFLIRQVAVTRVEALRQQKQAADPIPVFGEVRRVVELVFVTVRVIRPDVLDLVPLLPTAFDVLGVA